MLKSFEIHVHAENKEQASIEMDGFTAKFLEVAGEGPWECMEDYLMPDPAWVPGFGFYGKVQGYKGGRTFRNRAGETNSVGNSDD